jgi:hypothetical protein
VSVRFGETCDEALRRALEAAGLGSVEGAFGFDQGEDLHKFGLGHRRRTRLELTDDGGRSHVLFLKRYGRAPLRQRLRQIWTHGAGKSTALVEYEATRRLRRLGLTEMHEIACGSDAAGRSFVLLSEANGEPLEGAAQRLLETDDGARELTERLAELAGGLHGAGLVHRDFYACHVFARRDEQGRLRLGLIDVARVMRPRLRRRRWFIKDLAQLKHSMPAEWTGQRWEEFLRLYAQRCGCRLLGLASAVECKRALIARHAARRQKRIAAAQAEGRP